jgi:3-methyladenine DNA glycosylase/8-oxoguanine DNA glycosylase
MVASYSPVDNVRRNLTTNLEYCILPFPRPLFILANNANCPRVPMTTSTFTIPTPPNFNFWRTVYSHGWCVLPPFEIDKENRIFSRTFTLSSGINVVSAISGTDSKLVVRTQSDRSLTPEERNDVRSQVRHCFRLDEDYSEFFAEARKHAHYRWIPRLGAGRLLRAPTVFEDVVKMICTTNCTWGLTEIMVGNLTSKLGRRVGNGRYSFPTPAAIAGKSESFLRKQIKSGYRSPYLLELAGAVEAGKLDLESWRTSALPTEDLYRQVLTVKGIGAYAAGNILKLLGRYDYLGLDSWVRKKFSELHKSGRKTKDSTIEKYYKPFGKWKGLFFWLEMTRAWYTEKFPF